MFFDFNFNHFLCLLKFIDCKSGWDARLRVRKRCETPAKLLANHNNSVLSYLIVSHLVDLFHVFQNSKGEEHKAKQQRNRHPDKAKLPQARDPVLE